MGNNPETRGLQAWIANQLEKSPRISGFLALYTQYHVQRDKPNSYFKLKNMIAPLLGSARERHFALRERQPEHQQLQTEAKVARDMALVTSGS